MSTPEERLAELGLDGARGGAAGGGVRPGRRAAATTSSPSGQLPMRDGELLATGKVGGEVTEEEALRVRAAVRAQRDRRDQGRDRRPVAGQAGRQGRRVRGLDARLHRASRKVANGASELLGKVFGDAGEHARSAVGVAALPLDAPGRGRADRRGLRTRCRGSRCRRSWSSRPAAYADGRR